MGKSVKDLFEQYRHDNQEGDLVFADTELDLRNKDLDSLDGLEWFPDLNDLDCRNNNLINLDGIENCKKLERILLSNNKLQSLKGLEKLKEVWNLHVNNNNLNDFEGIEDLKNLSGSHTNFTDNPCSGRYIGLNIVQLREKVRIEKHLKPDDDRRGEASISDTGLFDFKGL